MSKFKIILIAEEYEDEYDLVKYIEDEKKIEIAVKDVLKQFLKDKGYKAIKLSIRDLGFVERLDMKLNRSENLEKAILLLLRVYKLVGGILERARSQARRGEGGRI